MAAHGTNIGLGRPTKRAKLDHDNIHPLKPSRKFVKIAGLLSEEDLQRPPLQQLTRDGRSILSKETRKPAKATPALTQPAVRRSKRREAHSLYLEFADIVEAYEEGAATSQKSRIEPIFQKLITRVDGKDVDGNPLDHTALVISEEDLQALETEREALGKPFNSELLTHKKTHSDGSTTITEVQLGQTLQSFEQKIGLKRAELEKLVKELTDVQAEIDAVRRDVQKREATEVKQARAELDEKLQELTKNATSARDCTLSAVAKGRKEDQASKVETAKRFEEIINTLA